MGTAGKAVPRAVRSILLIDDQPIMQAAFRSFASERRIVYAPTSARAFELLESESFDMAFVDLWMPDMRGIELLPALRARWPHMPVVMMSGMWTADTMQFACRAGALYCLDKVDTFVEEVGRVIAAWEHGEEPMFEPSTVDLPTLDDLRGMYILGLHQVCGENVSATADVSRLQRSSVQRQLKAARAQRDERRQSKSSTTGALARLARRKRTKG